MGFCGIFEVETDYVAKAITEDDPPQDKYKVFVVANAQNRFDYVEPLPASYSLRDCLVKSNFYRDMLGKHSFQIPQEVTDRSTGQSTIKPFFHCAFGMAPKDGEQVAGEEYLVYSKSARDKEEVAGKKMIAGIYKEAGIWFRTLIVNHEKSEFPERIQLIFRIMNAKTDNFFGPGSGIEREEEEEIMSNAERREMRNRMKYFFRANPL